MCSATAFIRFFAADLRPLLIALAAILAVPAAAQPDGGRDPSAKSDIVVVAERENRSDWKRAETDHVLVFSDGGEAELKRIAGDIERLHQLLSRLYLQGQQPEKIVKLRVILYNSSEFFRDMGLRNLRAAEGPYAAGLSDQRYYDPRDGGAVLAVARSDQVINLDTSKARDRDCEDIAASGPADTTCIGMQSRHAPAARPWEAVLYSAYAQHFTLSYLPAAYPRWYLDAVGALFSTTRVRHDGSIDYANAPVGYLQVFRSYGPLKVEDVLTGRYLDTPSRQWEWTPYHAWLLGHFFLYSDVKLERRAQFQRYMTAIHQGTPMAEAAKAFGDMRKLQREVSSYAARNALSYARTDPSPPPDEEPLISQLSLAGAAMLDAEVELDSQLAADGSSPGSTDWLARVRGRVAALPFDSDASLVVAEAECRSGHFQRCLAESERALASSPDSAGAMTWKGIALTGEALAGPAAARPDALAKARQPIERAIEIDGEAALPLIAYFQSFTKAGYSAPEAAVMAMAKAIRMVPAAPGPRLYLAEELVRQGKADLARRVVYPVLYGPYASHERAAAEALFAPRAGAR